MADLIGRLREVAGPAAFDDGQRSVHATIHLSYQHLSPGGAAAVPAAGLHPGPDAGRYAAAALTASSLEEAGRLLDGLVDDHMLQVHSRAR